MPLFLFGIQVWLPRTDGSVVSEHEVDGSPLADKSSLQPSADVGAHTRAPGTGPAQGHTATNPVAHNTPPAATINAEPRPVSEPSTSLILHTAEILIRTRANELQLWRMRDNAYGDGRRPIIQVNLPQGWHMAEQVHMPGPRNETGLNTRLSLRELDDGAVLDIDEAFSFISRQSLTQAPIHRKAIRRVVCRLVFLLVSKKSPTNATLPVPAQRDFAA